MLLVHQGGESSVLGLLTLAQSLPANHRRRVQGAWRLTSRSAGPRQSEAGRCQISRLGTCARAVCACRRRALRAGRAWRTGGQRLARDQDASHATRTSPAPIKTGARGNHNNENLLAAPPPSERRCLATDLSPSSPVSSFDSVGESISRVQRFDEIKTSENEIATRTFSRTDWSLHQSLYHQVFLKSFFV